MVLDFMKRWKVKQKIEWEMKDILLIVILAVAILIISYLLVKPTGIIR